MWVRQEGQLLDHWSDEVMRHYREEHLIPLDVRGLWTFREGLKDALVNKKSFKETYAAPLSRPETGVQLIQQRSGFEFPLRFELTKVASGLVTVTDAYHMYWPRC